MAYRNLLRALLAGVLIGTVGFANADQLTDRARTLLDKGDAKAAYALLEPLEPQRAGDPDYDFLLGLAALEIGRNTNAVFALERVLAVNPNHVRARAELARAYLALGETKTARQEFENVKKQGVPPEVSATIDRFLSTIERADDQGRTVVRGYLEASVGWDSNVNSATDGPTIAIPLFGGALFTLAPGSKKADDSYMSLGGGLNLRHPLNRNTAVVAGFNGNVRVNSSEDKFDTRGIDGSIGITTTRDKDSYTALFQASGSDLDQKRLRNAVGATGQWQRSIDARNQASMYVQYTDLRYPDQTVRNADRWVLGGGYAHAYRGGQVAFGGVYAGTEMEKAAGVPHLGHDLVGVRVGGQMPWSAKTALFASASLELRRYGGQDPLFLKVRNDSQFDLTLGADYTPAKDWKVTPKFSYTDNQSNVVINKFDRAVVSVTARREF
jgi:tetratricopeptide (TPR) repeat protein